MRNFYLYFIIALLFICCHQPMPPEIENQAPEEPAFVFPPNDTTNVPINITFRWQAEDTNIGDSLTYDFYLGTDVPELELIISNLKVDTLNYNLQYEKTYFWKVIDFDQKGDSSSSPIWKFTTRYKVNTPPNIPTNPQPQDGSTSVSIDSTVLCWEGGDPDSFSVVTYDVLLGCSPDCLFKISEDLSENKCELSLLAYDTRYYWQILARDSYGGEVKTTLGPVWNFYTETAISFFSESFDTCSVNQNPPASIWAVMESESDIFVTDEMSWNNLGNSVCFIDTTYEGSNFIATSLYKKAVGMVQFYWQFTSNNDVFGVRLYSQSAQLQNQGPEVSIRKGSLQCYQKDQEWLTICPVDTNRWYFIQLYLDCNQQYYNIYVDEKLMKKHVTWTGTAVENINLIYFLTFQNRTCEKAYLDEVKYFSKL